MDNSSSIPPIEGSSQLDSTTFNELTVGLRDESAKRREATILRYKEMTVRDSRITDLLQVIAASDPKDYVRAAAQSVLGLQSTFSRAQSMVSQPQQTQLPPPSAPSTPPPPPPSVIVVTKSKGPGCLVQALWFIFIGWWLGGLALSLAWILNVIIIGLPLGVAILNNIPKLLALQSSDTVTRATTKEGVTIITESSLPQHPFLLRALFFILIGWWWSGVWLLIGYFLCITIILMPIGFEVFRLSPAMTTLRRY